MLDPFDLKDEIPPLVPLFAKSKSQSQAYPMDAFVVPAHFCFCRRIEIPADLHKGEEVGFAILELERLSPFPLDHLNYGCCLDEAGRHAFVFAAYKRRFEPGASASWRRLDAVLPDFLPALSSQAKDSRPLVLLTPRSFVALSFDGRSTFPARFAAEARPIAEAPRELDPSELKSQMEAFWEEVKERVGGEAPRFAVAEDSGHWAASRAIFVVRELDGSRSAWQAGFDREEIWHADMRDPEVLEQARRDERQNGLMWKVGLGLAAAVAVLVAGEVVIGASRAYLSMREGWNQEREPMVQSIDRLQTTANTLSQFQESNLEPFAMIDAMMPYQRWPEIIYRRFETSGPDSLTIEARAGNQTQVNDFRRRLESFDRVRSVELPQQTTVSAGVNFTVSIQFVPGAFFQPQEVANSE